MAKIVPELLTLIESGYVLINLATFEEDRALEILAQAAQDREAALSVWSVTQGFGDNPVPPASPVEALARIAATESRALFALLDFHPYLSDPTVVRLIRDLLNPLQQKGQAIIFLTPSPVIPPELEKDFNVLELPLPLSSELRRILGETLARLGSSDLPPEVMEGMVRASLGLTARQALRVFTRALRERPRFTLNDIPLILEQKKEIIRRTQLLEFFEVSENLDHIGGLDQLKQWLMNRSSAFSESARRYGLPEPKGLLLLGVQGCGKSLCAKAVSNLWQMPLLRLDASMVLGSTQTSGEENMRRSIQLAESLAPCVLWIDEIEKGFSAQQISGGREGGRVSRAFAAFLVWLQEKTRPVYVIATANSIAELPPELVRKGRFDEIFFVDLPNLHERREIFTIHLRKRGRDPEAFDPAGLAKLGEGFSGSEIEQCLISAMYEAFTAGRELTSEDIRRALSDTVPLSETLEEKIQELRDWAKNRARPASLDTKLMDLFREGQQTR
jgi:ATP-dependent 26S proteasome regulatory subunit